MTPFKDIAIKLTYGAGLLGLGLGTDTLAQAVSVKPDGTATLPDKSKVTLAPELRAKKYPDQTISAAGSQLMLTEQNAENNVKFFFPRSAAADGVLNLPEATQILSTQHPATGLQTVQIIQSDGKPTVATRIDKNGETRLDPAKALAAVQMDLDGTGATAVSPVAATNPAGAALVLPIKLAPEWTSNVMKVTAHSQTGKTHRVDFGGPAKADGAHTIGVLNATDDNGNGIYGDAGDSYTIAVTNRPATGTSNGLFVQEDKGSIVAGETRDTVPVVSTVVSEFKMNGKIVAENGVEKIRQKIVQKFQQKP